MKDFIKRSIKKISKLTREQIEDLFIDAAEEIDRLETVLESLGEGILVCDTGHSLVLANKCAERFVPITVSTAGNDPLWSRIWDERIADFLEATLKSGDRVEDREFNVEAGIQRLLSISVLPLVREHRVTGSLIYIKDITEKRGREARLRRAENLASLTTLAAGVAHEIKNPLGSISIHIQLMQKALGANRRLVEQGAANTEGLDQLDKYIAVVNEEIDRLNHIVVDFLFAVRPMNLDLREGNINTLIGELMEFMGFELSGASIECNLDLEEGLPLLKFDERYLKQALLNLVKNAAAAMPGGGKLTVRTRQKDDEAFISVIDTGMGIPEENLAKIFEPYFTTKATGSGLGLTLVFKIIREHRGEISVESREGEGTSFTISLPIPQRERRLIGFEGSIIEGEKEKSADYGEGVS
ncbi:MAG: PAS domain-containing sensor histidine kinase [Treponema sp.]|jgi:signal transduction histidine kinase|nr:PAS domain-containing sensor histidine kinase [Treponema sp.]